MTWIWWRLYDGRSVLRYWVTSRLPLVFGKHWLILKSVFKYSRNAGCWFLCNDTRSESIEPLLGGWGVTTPGRGERGGRQAVVSLATAVNTRQEVKWWLADTEMVVLSPFTLSQWAETWHQWSECLYKLNTDNDCRLSTSSHHSCLITCQCNDVTFQIILQCLKVQNQWWPRDPASVGGDTRKVGQDCDKHWVVMM